jgi:N-acetylmuramoyl-L-alanine amidase
MNNRYRILVFIFSFFFLAIYANAAHISKSEYYSAKKDKTYIEKSRKVSRTSYRIVAEKFYHLYSKAPKDALADDSLYLCAETWYKSYKKFRNKNDLKQALKYYRLLAVNYNSWTAAKAYLSSADIYIILKDYASAKYTLYKLIKRFPKRTEAKIARKKIAEIDKKYLHKKTVKKHKKITSKPKKVTYSSKKTTIKGIRHFSDLNYSRIVIDVDRMPKYEQHWLKANPEHNKPPRLFIDIENSVVGRGIPKAQHIKDGLLKSIRWGTFKKNTTRIVLDSENVQDFKVFPMVNPNRIVIDVSSKNIKFTRKDKIFKTKTDNLGKGTTLAKAFGLKVNTIVIDPGHGGKDPGATYNGLKEKDIVLDLGLKLRGTIKRNNPNLKVYMTRSTDIFIPLEERTAFANRKRADIFVSIHINAARNKKAHGIETYVLNVTNDKGALAVAALENQATTKSLSDLQGILKDIMLNSKLEESLMLAGAVQKNLTSIVKAKSLGVKQAPFYVLVGAKMPSILIECGFISNRQESKKLKSNFYRQKIAEGIYKGLKSYINQINGSY